MKRMFVSLLAVAMLAIFGAIASAAPAPTPNGFVGACNMVASWPDEGPAQGVGVEAGGGMERAMTVDNPNGNLGMDRAVTVSGGFCP